MNECGQVQQANRWRSPRPRRVRENQLVACRLLPSRADNGGQRGATAAGEHLHEQTRRRQKSAPPTRYGGLGNHRWRRRQWRRRRRRRDRTRLHRRPASPQMPRDERRQRLPYPFAGRALMAHDPDPLRSGLGAQGPLAVVVHVQHRVPALRAIGWPVPIRIAQPPLVLSTVGHVLRDPRAALLAGRVRPTEAGCWIRRRESLLAHGVLQGVATPRCPTSSAFSTFRPGDRQPERAAVLLASTSQPPAAPPCPVPRGGRCWAPS